jgi:hypothetical protein
MENFANGVYDQRPDPQHPGLAKGRGIKDIRRTQPEYGTRQLLSQTGRQDEPRCAGMKRTVMGRRNSKSDGSSNELAKHHVKRTSVVALCVKATGSGGLTTGKLYRIIPDTVAKQEQMLRIVDDSGENYLYPNGYFHKLKIPTYYVRFVGK